MDKQFTYLLIDLMCIVVPLLASFHPKSPFYKEWRWFLPANILVAILFLVWDAAFTRFGIWGFNDDYITGIKLGNLPLEEVLFFICIPYACTYTYYVFSKYVKLSFAKVAVQRTYLLVSALLLTALLNYSKLYTLVTFISLSVFLALLIRQKVTYLDRFYLVFLIILVPFFISNGLLTGSWLDSPIVWYNDNHNLGIRLLTIPVEDTMYALLMLLMNVAGYEWLKSKATNTIGKVNNIKTEEA